VLTLGVGIALATAMFGLVDAVLLRPLPFRDPGTLVWVCPRLTDRDRAFYSAPNFRDVVGETHSFADLAGLAPWGTNLFGTPTERLLGARVSPSTFALLGVQALHGRTFTQGDDAAVVLGHELWVRRFGGDPGIVGQSLVLDGERHTVVGVLPRWFSLPNLGNDLYAPLFLDRDRRRNERGSNFLRVIGRLAPGTSAGQAAEELGAITRRLVETHPETNAKMVPPAVVPLDEELVGAWRSGLTLLLAGVVLVLAVACASFAGAQLARVAGRRDELALRAALGATPRQIFAELLAESLLLAGLAGICGALISPWALQLVVAAAPAGLPRAADAAIDARALGFATLATLATAALTSLAPATGDAARAGTTVTPRAREIMVVAQLALALVLLAAAGLLGRGTARLAAVDPGFDARGVIALRLSLPPTRYPSGESMAAFHRTLAARLQAMPEIAGAVTGSYAPMAGANSRTDFTVIGRPATSRAEVPGAQWRFIGPGWFAALGIPVVAGREISLADEDSGHPVAVVSRALAERFLPGQDPVGARLRIEDGVAARDVEIVGVVGDVPHFAVDEAPLPTLYLSLRQAPPAMGPNLATNLTLVVKTRAHLDGERLREAVAQVDVGVAASRPLPLADALAAQLAPRRLALAVVGLFALASLLLSAGGLAATVAWQVTRRRRELGIRMALGATPGRVVRGVVASAARLVAGGTLAGLVVAIVAGRLLAHPDLGALDPLAFAAAALVLGAVAVASAWLAARRAARVDPAIALRAT